VAERGVESLFGGSKRVGWDCSLVTSTVGEPSRSCHGEGHVRQSWFRIGCGGSLRGTETCTRARSDHGTGETRLRTGNAAEKFRQIDRYVAWRLKRLLVKRKGRNLRAGEAAAWTEDWLHGMGLHRLLGTIRYPGTA